MKDEAERWDAGFHGHGRGVVVSNDGHGNFSERPMTIAEKQARTWALRISDGVNDLYRRGSAAFVYHRVWEFVALAIADARNVGYRAGWDAARADATGGRSLIPEAFQDETESEWMERQRGF